MKNLGHVLSFKKIYLKECDQGDGRKKVQSNTKHGKLNIETQENTGIYF